MNQEKLLYQSRGCSSKIKIIISVFVGIGALMTFMMIALFILGFSVIDAEEFIIIFMSALFFITCTIISIITLNSYRSCWIKLYDTSWEGKPFVAFGQSAPLKFSYLDIQAAQIEGLFLRITVNGVTHKMICTEPERALQIISSKIRATR